MANDNDETFAEDWDVGRLGLRALQGAIAGLIGTLLMTVIMIVGRSVGRPWALPPRVIARQAEHEVGIRRQLSRSEFSISWILAHTAYGVVVGTLYAVLRPILPRSTVVAGLAYGSAIWGISYLGIMPALGLYPPPREDIRTRIETMIVAHLTYGLSVAVTDSWLCRHLSHA